MSQFRIKNIDNSIPDEWVYKLNDGVNVVGDDIDARDPNELADAIYDTQNILLKVSTLPSGAILKANSGIAERITILEGIAGNSTLQDIYANGSTISVITGKPLTFGIREEFKLDDAGNLSFKPVTMKVRGTGFQTLDFTNLSVTTNLGDLLVGATSPGAKLTLRAEDYLYLKDVFLSNPITLSEPGHTSLGTTSQSVVGAINELKASSFSTTFQSVYSQSQPPKLTTNITQGAVIIEDPNPLSAADALRIIGILNVTKKAKVGDLKVGLNTVIADTTGYVSSDPIKTTNRVETPAISSGTNDLVITDKRVSFPFSDTSVSDLSTTRKSVIGAINELKADITTVGNATNLFNVEHKTDGKHGIITTQAEIGNNATPRIVIRPSGSPTVNPTFTVNGSGEVVAASAVVAGLSVGNLLNQLVAHIANDGTAHSAFAAHLTDNNPHNTVKSILNLTGNIFFSSADGSIDITTSGNTVDFTFNNTTTLQQVYENLVTKELTLIPDGLMFRDELNTAIINLRAENIAISKNLLFDVTTPVINSNNTLTVQPDLTLNLSSTTQDVSIQTVDSTKKVKIQNVDFNEAGASTLPSTLGTSVLGAFKKLNDNIELTALNAANNDINFQFPHFIDSLGRAWPHIANLHSANEFVSGVDFFWANNSALYFPKGNIVKDESGFFLSSGTHNLIATSGVSLPLAFHKGAKLYPICLSYNDLTITSVTSMVDGQTLNIDGDLDIIGRTGIPDISLGEFKIEQSGVAKLKADKTRDNIIATINSQAFHENSTNNFSLKAGIWGEASKAYLRVVNTVTAGQTVSINSTAITGEAETITLTASATATGFSEFLASADLAAVASTLADAINRTAFRQSATVLGLGHKCKAKVVGSTVVLEWYKPGQSGDLVVLGGSALTTNITSIPFSGGTCVLRIYDLDVGNTALLTATTSLTGSVLTGLNFVAKEKTSEYFLTADEALASSRYSPNYRARELGTVEAVSGNTIAFKIRG